jgi:mitogen-activated protein kinase kinase
MKPTTIMEEDEEEFEATPVTTAESNNSPLTTASDEMPGGVVDKEVADWVKDAIERRRSGKMSKSEKPALHAAPLDMVSSPGKETSTKNESTVSIEVADPAPSEVEDISIDADIPAPTAPVAD